MHTAPSRMLCLCLVLGLGSCASRSGQPADAHGKLTQVLVSIYGLDEARVRAVLIDREGRRTGWNVDRSIRQIPGVLDGYGTAEGIPDEDAPADTSTPSPADTVPGHPEPTPKYYYLSIEDSLGTPGLLRESGCDLRLDPERSGHVTLAVTGHGIGLEQCQDTTSLNVIVGVPSLWRLSWSVGLGKCDVKVDRVPRRKATGR